MTQVPTLLAKLHRMRDNAIEAGVNDPGIFTYGRGSIGGRYQGIWAVSNISGNDDSYPCNWEDLRTLEAEGHIEFLSETGQTFRLVPPTGQPETPESEPASAISNDALLEFWRQIYEEQTQARATSVAQAKDANLFTALNVMRHEGVSFEYEIGRGLRWYYKGELGSEAADVDPAVRELVEARFIELDSLVGRAIEIKYQDAEPGLTFEF